MTVADLQNGSKVRYRVGRYHDDMSHPDWQPWTFGPLYVQRDNKGQVAIVTLEDGSWAEYDPRRCPPVNGVFESEGYYLEVTGLEA